MNLQELELLINGDLDKAVNEVRKCGNSNYTIYNSEFDTKLHRIMDKGLRPDKLITTQDTNDAGVTTNITSSVKVARLALPLQKQIVDRAASFLCGNPIKLNCSAETPDEKQLLEVIKKTWDDNKLDYKSKRLAKLMMAETECAELWYTQETDPDYWQGTSLQGIKYKLRCRLLHKSYDIKTRTGGDDLYPVYDSTGDMVAFGRGYVTTLNGKEIKHLDIYTSDRIYQLIYVNGGWTVEEGETGLGRVNIIGKIPVIYYSQTNPEWHDVSELIDRLETIISNNADTNDYFGSPMIKAVGKIESISGKSQTGKVVEMEAGASLEYLTWNQAPEAVKMEINNLVRFIYGCTDTPDISFEAVKELGLGQISGIALKMLFLGAHLKASDKEEIFGESVQRRINYLKYTLAGFSTTLKKVVNLNIKPQFEYFLPKNDQEAVNTISAAVTGGFMSIESAINNNPLIKDKETEVARVKDESKNVKVNVPVNTMN